MSKKVRILIVEDSDDDCQLILREMRRNGFELTYRRVESEAELRKSLSEEPWDLVLCDYSLPQFNALAALRVLKEDRREVPLLIVSGTVGEDTAVEAMRAGARDFILKGRFARLIPAITRELTEAKNRARAREAEVALEKSEGTNRLLTKITKDAIWDWNLKTDEVSWNQGVSDLFGYPSKSIGKNFEWYHERIHPNDRQKNAAVIQNLIAGNVSSEVAEYRFIRHDGTFANVLERFYALADSQGEVVRIVGSMTDISALREAEKQITERERQLNDAQEIAQVGSWTYNLEQDQITWSDELYRIFGYSPHDFAPSLEKFFQIIHPFDLERFKVTMNENIRTRVPYQQEYQVILPSGEIKFIQSRGQPVFNESGNLIKYNGTAQDITARKTAEKAAQENREQIQHLQKMDAIGRLAGGIAHDYNNMLAAIDIYSDLALEEVGIPDQVRQNLKEIKQIVMRGASLTRQLLFFSRKQMTELKPVSLYQITKNLEKMLQRLIGERIELHTHFSPNEELIDADPGLIEQILMNLVLNARDAITGNGNITIHTSTITVNGSLEDLPPGILPGTYSTLSVADDGHGMDSETQKKIFEPFFTTKAVGKGTGLGLSTVYGIVAQLKGLILVKSEPSKGALFRIYFPCSSKSDEESVPEPVSIGENRLAVKILVIEDEEKLRDLITKVLMKIGYQVVSFTNGSEALDFIGNSTDSFHFIISDIVMPKMGGIELRESLLKRGICLPTLFMSGYPDDFFKDRDPNSQDLIYFIQKPFGSIELLKKVNEILNSAVCQHS